MSWFARKRSSFRNLGNKFNIRFDRLDNLNIPCERHFENYLKVCQMNWENSSHSSRSKVSSFLHENIFNFIYPRQTSQRAFHGRTEAASSWQLASRGRSSCQLAVRLSVRRGTRWWWLDPGGTRGHTNTANTNFLKVSTKFCRTKYSKNRPTRTFNFNPISNKIRLGVSTGSLPKIETFVCKHPHGWFEWGGVISKDP